MINFNMLAAELKLKIFNYLTDQEQIKFSTVCQDWNVLLNDDELWKNNMKSFGDLENFGFFAGTNLKQKYINYAFAIQELHGILTAPYESADLHDDYLDGMTEYTERMENLFKKRMLKFTQLLPGFLNKYPDINKQYALSSTLLHFSIALGDAEATSYLLTHTPSANPNQLNGRDDSPLMLAAYYFDIYKNTGTGQKMIELLIENQADIATGTRQDVINYANRISATEVVHIIHVAIAKQNLNKISFL